MSNNFSRVYNDDRGFVRQVRSGNNSSKPYVRFAGLNRENTSIERQGAMLDVAVKSGDYSKQFGSVHPVLGSQPNQSSSSYTYSGLPEINVSAGYGLDLKLRSKIATTDFNALVTAAEMKETIVGLGSLAKRLGNAYGALRRGNLKTFCQELDVSRKGRNPSPTKVRDNAAGYLLEYQFGIVPIYGDMLGLATTIYDQSQFPARIKYKVFDITQDSSTVIESFTPRFLWTDGTLRNHGSIKRTATAKVTRLSKACTTVEVNSALKYYLSQFGFTNPLHAAYSVAPSSWLFDAFIPLGDFLSQLYLPPGISVKDGGYTHLIESTFVFPSYYYDKSTYTYSYKNASGQTRNGSLSSRTYCASSKGKVFKLRMEPHDFSQVSMQIKPSLPFVGQAITATAYAHTRADDLKNLLARNAR